MLVEVEAVKFALFGDAQRAGQIDQVHQHHCDAECSQW